MAPSNAKSLAHTDEAIKKLQRYILSFLQNWNNDPSLRKEIKRIEVAIDRFSKSRKRKGYKYPWTAAIYACFRQLADDPQQIGHKSRHRWIIYPSERPYAGEFMTDFAIYEEGYGFRVACESQWHEANNTERVSDAFAKLLHVKSDLKVLIFESPHDEGCTETKLLFDSLHRNYLKDYMHFSAHEDYLLMQWHGSKARCYLWRPFNSKKLNLIEEIEI